MTGKRNPLAVAGETSPGPLRDAGSGPVGASAGKMRGGAGGDDSGGGRLVARPDIAMDRICAAFPMTDLGNAERFRARYGDNFRFCAEIGWFAWDGRRWCLLSEEKDKLPARVMQAVFLTVRAIRNEAALIGATGIDPDALNGLDDADQVRAMAMANRAQREGERQYCAGLDEPAAEKMRAAIDALPPANLVIAGKSMTVWSASLASWAKSSEGSGRLNCIAALAKSFSQIVIQPDQLDHDRMAINCLNGTLRLERVKEKRASADIEAGKSEWRAGDWQIKLHKHDRADLITKMMPVKYVPAARCPVYDEFIARVQPDPDMRRFIHQWGGLSLTGHTGEQKLAFFYGAGRNGKGTWVEAIAGIIGDYAGSIPIESFLQNGSQRRGDQATPDIARLPGVRMLRVSEPAAGSTLNEGLVKQVTGEDPVDARHLNKGLFTFLPQFKMTISGNNKPNIKDTSDGIWRRMQLVPWDVQIAEDQVDRHLKEKLKAEAEGILMVLVRGLIDWRNNGLITPEAVKAATRQYRDSSDDLGRFLRQCCEVGGDAKVVRVRSADLYAAYEAWADATGGAPWKIKGFKKALEDKSFRQFTSNGAWWANIRLLDSVDAEAIKSGRWSTPDDDQDAVGGAGGNSGASGGPPAPNDGVSGLDAIGDDYDAFD